MRFGYRRQGSGTAEGSGTGRHGSGSLLPTWFGYWPTRVGYWPTRFGYSRQGSGTADMHPTCIGYWPTCIGYRASGARFGLLWWRIGETRSGRPTPDTRCMSASTRCMSASTRCMSASTRCMSASTRTLSPVPEPCRLRRITSALLAKRRQFGLRKADAEDKAHGLTQQSPISKVANIL